MKKILNKASLHLLIASLSLLSAIILSDYLSNRSGKNFDVQRVSEYIHSKEAWMQEFTQELDQFIIDDQGFALSDVLINEAERNGVYVFVYQDDSLIAWSNNNLLPPPYSQEEGSSFSLQGSSYQLSYIQNQSDYTYNLVFPVYYLYPFENEYLINRINPAFGIEKECTISMDKEGFPVHNLQGDQLFYIDFPQHEVLYATHAVIVFVLYILAFIYFIAFLYLVLKKHIRNSQLFILVWVASLVLIRLVLIIFQIPSVLYESELFQPSTFAVNLFFPSLGDYFLHSLFTIFIVYVLFKNLNLKDFLYSHKSYLSKYLINLVLILALFIITDILFVSVRNLLLHSKINFNLIDPSNLNYLSVIGIVILILNSFVYLIVSIRLIKLIKISGVKKLWSVLTFLVILSLHFFFSQSFSEVAEMYSLYIVLFFGALFIIPESIKEAKITTVLISFILLAFGFNNLIIQLNESVEHDTRKSLIRDLSLNQDPKAEYLFNQVESKIYSDSALIGMFMHNTLDYSSIESHLLNNYFKDQKHWDRYDFLVTICDQYVDLIVKPQNYTVNCQEFFYQQLMEFGRLTDSKNLYYLEYGTGQTNYLGLFRFELNKDGTPVEYTIYLEVNSKLKREGYSKLLTESGLDPFEKIQNYSLARYQDNSLMENYGRYSYPDTPPVLRDTLDEYEFWDKNGFNHLTYRMDSEHLYVLSRKNDSGVSKLVPFSYLFVFMIILVLLLTLLLNSAFEVYRIKLNYSSRLQLTIIMLLLVAFGIIAGVSVYYIQNLDESSNQQKIKELATSLQTEFEHKVQKEGSFQVLTEDNMNELAVKFSKVFNTDINLYTLDGELLATTRNKVFESHLQSKKINPLAYNALTREKETFFVHKENIGELEFYSAYLPFHDGDDQIVAFLNLPYFAKQNELRKDVSGFILTLINIYTLIIVISILAALVVSNYITRPLILIRNKMREVQLGKSNEKISWERDDEIGQLVKEYNRMIGELAESAELLAKSERASAWREMAQQVAHEIKNPLTPMRMSIQFLQRAWEDQAEDREERLQRLLVTLIEQIDTLSDIASAFSDFAKMPKLKNEVIDVVEIINSSVEIHKDIENIAIDFYFEADKDYQIWADRKHILRVFNNLIKNSIQAIDNPEGGKITLTLTEEEEQYKISVKDTGKGIPEELRDKIFVPNFTTKSSGTGLGLAMVKNIILSAQGSIDFTSEENVGTVFIIHLPIYQASNHESVN